MTKRRPGELVTPDTRGESHEKVDKAKRYRQIVECLEDYGPMTAKQVAVAMKKKGFIPTDERSYAAPRLTEMSLRGIVEPIGKTTDGWTGRTVAVYGLVEV